MMGDNVQEEGTARCTDSSLISRLDKLQRDQDNLKRRQNNLQRKLVMLKFLGLALMGFALWVGATGRVVITDRVPPCAESSPEGGFQRTDTRL